MKKRKVAKQKAKRSLSRTQTTEEIRETLARLKRRLSAPRTQTAGELSQTPIERPVAKSNPKRGTPRTPTPERVREMLPKRQTLKVELMGEAGLGKSPLVVRVEEM